MQTFRGSFFGAAVSLCLASLALLAAGSGARPVDDDLSALRRVFPGVGAGLRAVRLGPDGNYYVLAAPNNGVTVFDKQGKQIRVIGTAPAVVGAAVSTANVAPKPAGSSGNIVFGEDCDLDKQGNVFIADRGSNAIVEFSPAGAFVRSIAVANPISIAALPEGEVAVTTMRQAQLVTVYGPDGRVAREFGQFEDLSSREDLNRYLNAGRVTSDPQGKIYYGFTYEPEPLVRQYDRFGYAGIDFEFTGLDAFAEASTLRREIARQEKRSDPPSFHPVLTGFGVDPVHGDVWMVLHNTLLHFDKDGVRQSEYRIYTKDGARLEGTVVLVEENRLLIGSDPLGLWEFERPDRKH